MSCRFQCESPVLIHDDSVAAHLYHIAQEAVNNAIKHGEPKKILIRLTAETGQGQIGNQGRRERNYGRRCELPGMGLHIMKYRSGMIGGALEIQAGYAAGNDRDLHFSGEGGRDEHAHLPKPPNGKHAAKPEEDCLVVDDHPLLRQGLAMMINREPDLTVCGEAEEAPAAMKAISATRPDILIVDISLNGPDGLDLLKNLRAFIPTCRC